MYQVRLLSSRYARPLEWLYDKTHRPIIALLKFISKRSNGKADNAITLVEKHIKGFLFDCKMCGNCVLSITGMTCPMNCPKTMRNGPCGGVRHDGHCEVKPEMQCVWLQAWQGAEKMKKDTQIHEVEIAVNHQMKGKSSWLVLANNDAD